MLEKMQQGKRLGNIPKLVLDSSLHKAIALPVFPKDRSPYKICDRIFGENGEGDRTTG